MGTIVVNGSVYPVLYCCVMMSCCQCLDPSGMREGIAYTKGVQQKIMQTRVFVGRSEFWKIARREYNKYLQSCARWWI